MSLRNVVVCGYGAVTPFGTAETSFLIRTGRLMEALPELQHLTGGRDLEALVHGMGIRVIEPGDTETGVDPQRFERWVLDRKDPNIRRREEICLGAIHAGVLLAGWNLSAEIGLPQNQLFKNYARVHYMAERALVEGLIRMGTPWRVIEENIPSSRRFVAGAHGLAPGGHITRGMQNPILGEHINAYTLAHYISPAMAFYIGKRIGAGDEECIQDACNTGARNLRSAHRRIAHGEKDFAVVVTGESAIVGESIEGFLKKMALATNAGIAKLGCHPSEGSRPALADRMGFIMGEGLGLMILAEETIARKLGLRIYARLNAIETRMGPRGSSDMAAPTIGVELAMEDTLRAAAEQKRTTPEEEAKKLLAIRGHGTSTPAGDISALQAYSRVLLKLGRDPRDPVVISYDKGGPRLREGDFGLMAGGIGYGHLLGGATLLGAMESVQIVYHGILPPSVGSFHLVDPRAAQLPGIVFATTTYHVGGPQSQRKVIFDGQGFGDGNGCGIVEGVDDGETPETVAWTNAQLQAIIRGEKKPVDYLPSMTG